MHCLKIYLNDLSLKQHSLELNTNLHPEKNRKPRNNFMCLCVIDLKEFLLKKYGLRSSTAFLKQTVVRQRQTIFVSLTPA